MNARELKKHLENIFITQAVAGQTPKSVLLRKNGKEHIYRGADIPPRGKEVTNDQLQYLSYLAETFGDT
ncbi:MAG: hypothetical protein K8R77_11835 [Anaerolineaceae bacterium]|nr:hypothetical protein [Anaerolineaceae bacterium]